MKQLGYYFMLVLRYRKKHLLETIYSLLAITISVILCYCSITVGFTLMNWMRDGDGWISGRGSFD